MSYVPVPITLPRDKLRLLTQGRGIRLSPHHVGRGGVTVHMTRRQADKMTRHHRAGKGVIMRLSPAQMRYHMKGEGWFSDLVSKGKDLAVGAAKKLAPGLIDKAVPYVQKAASSVINKYVPESLRGIAQKGVDYGVGKAVDYGKSKIGGGVKRSRKAAGIAGRGVASRKRTGQLKRTPHHPTITSFERDPLPGEHMAIPQ